MAYIDGSRIIQSMDMRARITQCARVEGIENPDTWVAQNIGAFAAQPGWTDAWASAEALRETPIGADGSVISDAQILAAVQSINKDAGDSVDGADAS